MAQDSSTAIVDLQVEVLENAAGQLTGIAPEVSTPVLNHTPRFGEFFTTEMEAAVEAVLSQMTVDEKIKLVNGDVEGRGPKHRGSASIDRLGVETMVFYNGPRGYQMGLDSTLFTSGVGQAAAFDPDRVEQIAGAIAREFALGGWQVFEAPSINIIRDPLNGRNFEYFTEDPLLNYHLAGAFVRGVQRQNVVATAKHFIANNQERNRNQVNAVMDERTLHEIYLPGFKGAVDAGVLSLMTGANRVNGPHSSANPDLIHILKNDWGWPGFLYTDWNGAQDSDQAINAGLDLSMPGQPTGSFGFDRLKSLYEQGEIGEDVLTDKARRLLRGAYYSGMIPGAPVRKPAEVDRRSHHALARDTARAGMTLVKNDGGLLPLTDTDRTIAVLGPLANKRFSEQTGGSSGVRGVPYDVTALQGLTERFGADRVVHVPFSMDEVFQSLGEPYITHEDTDGQILPGFKAVYRGKDPVTGEPRETAAVEPKIEFNWEMASPNREMIRPQDFTARWTGTLRPPLSGPYTLRIEGTHIVYVELDGETVLNKHFIQHQKDLTLALEADRAYEIAISFRKPVPHIDNRLRISWIKPDAEQRVADILRRSAEAARDADVALVLIGQDHNTESEGMDRTTMRLPAYHDQLVAAVREANPRTAVVVYCGTPVSMDPWFDTVPAVVLPWLPGMENGNALADVLSGDVDFGGRSPISFPKQYTDSPAHPSRQDADKGKTILHHEGVFVGYRWFDATGIEPLIPFGHGLSTTTFAYDALQLSAKTRQPGEPLTARFTVTNTGERPGIEIPQLYVHDVKTSLPRPPHELKAFTRLELAPGQSETVTFELTDEAFAFFDPQQREWAIEPGAFELRVGRSSRDILLHAEILHD